MTKAKILTSGNGQAVRLPKAFRFSSAEVEIPRRGDEVILRERRRTPADGVRCARRSVAGASGAVLA